jgi:hypothetical protein
MTTTNPTPTAAQSADPFDPTAVVRRCAELVSERYVFAEAGRSAAEGLLAALDDGRYAACATPEELATAVTAHLEELAGDLHLRLLFHPVRAVGEEDPEALAEQWREQARRTAGGVRRVERLEGNIALVDLAPVICHPAHAGDAISAALSLVADADALVLDVRECRGGSPDGVALVISHLVGADPVRLGDIESREEGVRQFWTQACVAGRRFGPDKPVRVLTSAGTFSGGEALAFDLHELGRARVVGEVTRGGAHPRVGFSVHPQLELTVPVARSVSPRTGTNWEGRGIHPDVPVPADRALEAALAELGEVREG